MAAEFDSDTLPGDHVGIITKKIDHLASALARLVQDVHRQFGQPVPCQDVDRPTIDHFLRGGDPVTEKAAAVGDAQGRHPAAGERTAHDGTTVTIAQRDDGDVQMGDRVVIVYDNNGVARAVRDTSGRRDK